MIERRGIKILIVEDNTILSFALRKKLEKLGYETIEIAHTGESAIEIAEQMKPDVVLMDIKLKGKMDGIEAAEHIHAMMDTLIIYVTAYSGVQILKRIKTTAPYSYIMKPIDERELFLNIEIALYKHKTQALLSQKREWEALGILSYGIVHDFNNMLQVIQNSLEFLETKCFNEDAKCKKILSKALNHFKEIESLIKKLSFIFTPGQLDKTDISVKEIINEAKMALIEEYSLPQTQIIFKDQTRQSLLGDKQLLITLVENLFLNAEEAMESQLEKKITIYATDMDMKRDNPFELPEGSYIHLSIKDEGKGIPPEIKDRIFEPYITTKQDYSRKGLGFGLTICAAITRVHGGHISIESQEGKGTTVHVHLPAAVDV